MKFIIHYDGKYQDELVLEADTIEEIRENANCETSRRGWDDDDCWSERINN